MSEKGGDAMPLPDARDCDAAELERLRELLIQSGKLADLGTQVASLVHEMNQPLVAIKAFAQMLRGSIDEPTSQRRAAFIEEQAEALERLVGRIRRYARQGHTADVGVRSDLGAMVATALDLVEHHLRRADVDLVVDVAPGPLMVPLDSLHVQQLLVNLLTNAADAVEGRETRRVRLSAAVRANHVWVQIADTGVGIPADLTGRILEPFFTTKDVERGTGLGLPICQEIVMSCGGRLDIYPAGDDGTDDGFVTRVEVLLPSAVQGGETAALEGGSE